MHYHDGVEISVVNALKSSFEHEGTLNVYIVLKQNTCLCVFPQVERPTLTTARTY